MKLWYLFRRNHPLLDYKIIRPCVQYYFLLWTNFNYFPYLLCRMDSRLDIWSSLPAMLCKPPPPPIPNWGVSVCSLKHGRCWYVAMFPFVFKHPRLTMKESPEVKLHGSNDWLRPLLEYPRSAWDHWQEYLWDKLENIQQRSARCITSENRLILLVKRQHDECHLWSRSCFPFRSTWVLVGFELLDL